MDAAVAKKYVRAETVFIDGTHIKASANKNKKRKELAAATARIYAVTERFPEIKTVTMDSAYRTPWICKRVFEDKRQASLPYKCPMTKDGFFRKYEYVYDEYYDCVLCPENQVSIIDLFANHFI